MERRDSLGWRIEQARRRAGLTQRDLAAAVGRSRQAISDYESDETEPPANIVAAIAKATDVPIDRLLHGEAGSDVLHGGLLGLLSGEVLACPNCGQPLRLDLVCHGEREEPCDARSTAE